jgi:hypothetical protein
VSAPIAERHPEADRVRRLVETWLCSDDAVMVLIDRTRAISYMRGFGLSPCQLELLGVQIEENVRVLLTDAAPAVYAKE